MLNEAQKRRVSVTFSSLEENLHDMERLLKGGDYIGIVHAMYNDVPEPVRDALLAKIAQVKNRIRSLAERFDLKREQRSLSRRLFAQLSYDWTTLEETTTRHLQGYGDVAKELKETLDPELNAIIGLIVEMERLLNAGKQ